MRRFSILFAAALATAWWIAAVSCDDINVGSDDSAKIRAGEAPNDDDAAGDDDDSTSGALAWNGTAGQFFSRYCVACHGPSPIDGDAPRLDSYDRITDELGEVRETIAEGEMPESYKYPSSEQIAQVVAWANAGAPQSGWSAVGPILDKYCVYCHSNPTNASAPFALDTYEAAADEAEGVAEEMDEGGMPPEQPMPTSEEIDLFFDWIDAGAPEN